MEFGFAHVPSGPYTESVKLIQLAEDLGYTWAWIADQTYYHDPYLILSAAALSTKHIKLGIGVTNPYTRHPAMTARAAATLDEISSGRFVLGIGAGNQRELIKPLGIQADAPARACREAIHILRGLWSGQPLTALGDEFRVNGIQLEFGARPGIRIYVGGRGPQILSMAGREADGVILSLAGLDRAWDLVMNGAQTVGRNPNALHRVAWGECALLEMGADVERYRVRVAHVLGRAPEKGLRIMGLTQDEIAQIKDAFEKGGPEAAANHVSDQILHRHLLIGTAKECAAELQTLEAKGVQAFAYLIKEQTLTEKRKALETFAHKVMT